MVSLDTLNPAQRETLAALGAGDRDARIEFPTSLAGELRSSIETALNGHVDHLEKIRPLIVTKRLLAGMHGCQTRYLHEQDQPFELSVPIVRGTVAHKALELSVHWPTAALPLELVDAAISLIAQDDHWAGDWVAGLEPADHADLRSKAAEMVSQFLETWPPLTPAMRPSTEVRISTPLCDGAIVCKGQADLMLGQPIGSGSQARKIIVDYKTGGHSPEHRADLRFYALVETLRVGVPPRMTVTAYLNSATRETEVITTDILFATAARVTDGIITQLALDAGQQEPARRPSPMCRWCDLLPDCEPGQASMDEDR